jgi:hypothetical protein
MLTSPKVISRAVASRKLYGPSAKSGGSIDAAIAGYHDRWLGNRRDDAEAVATARRERPQIEAFAKKFGITPNDLTAALNVLLERETFRANPESIAARRAATLEALRLEHGGSEQAQVYLHRYLRVTTALAQEVPSLATRANATGAGEDPRIINALAKYGDAPVSATTEE